MAVVEFAPAFGALLVEALQRQATTWSLELLDAGGEQLYASRIATAERDGSLALRIATARAAGQREGRAAAYRLVNAVGVLLMAGDCGPAGSGAALEIRGDGLVKVGAPIEIAGTLRW